MTRPPGSPELSAIILGYRAEEHLRPLAEALWRELVGLEVDFEVILVANYRADVPDATPSVAADLASRYRQMKVIAAPKRGGMGEDMRSGFEAARGEFMVVIDGDGQNPVSDIVRAYQHYSRTGADLVKGRRTARADSFARRVISRAYNLIFTAMFGTRGLGDINGKPKGVRRAAYERMELRSDDWFADAELVLEARRLDMTIEEVRVQFNENEHRDSFVGWKAIAEFMRNMLARRLRR